MISRSIDQLTCQCRPFRCCQAYPGDQGHHDKPSHPAARHDCLDGDATRDLRIACADRTARRGASQGRRRAPGRQEGSAAEGCAAAGCRTEGTGSSATPGRCTSTSSSPSAATACCGSATASNATPAASGGCASSASDATSAAPGCRAEGADSAPATPGGCTFAPDAAAASSTGSRPCGAEATGRTDDATPTAAFISEGDAITRAAAATAGWWRQAAAGTCHHAGSNSAADRRPATWRKHDGAAASRRTGDASECGRPDNHTNHAAGATRRAAACRAKRWRRPHRSGRNAAGRRAHGSWRRGPHGADRRAGRAEFSATSRPGAKRPADCHAGLPSGPASHRTVASGPAAGRRRHQSHSRGCATSRTAAP